MAPLDVFEASLKEVVHAKRLSASKMTKLTEIALKSMEHDTQIVSILYRTHKSLPAPGKVSSLYVFDALSRAARHQVTKQGLIGDINSPQGNAATFLLKVEGVLEGVFLDLKSTGYPEVKEKSQKILDIWVKGNTFPSKILTQLMKAVKENEKVPEVISVTPSDPRTSAISTSTPIMTPETSTLDPQATLLALLAQAANVAAVPIQTTANTGVNAGLDAAQLAVLQQLALAQTASSPANSETAPSQAVPTQSGSALSTSYGEEPISSHLKDRRFDGHQGPERVTSYDRDDRPSIRGSFRGGFRGRGRGRWDDRERDRYRDRERDDRSPPRRRSRSRSPPGRFGGRRGVRPYSPPRRPNASMAAHGRDPSDSGAVSNENAEKDEFGRDLRPRSPDSDTTTPPPKLRDPLSLDQPVVVSSKQSSIEVSPLTSNHEQMSLQPVAIANTPPITPSVPLVSSVASTQSGLEEFNPATFDFTSAASWEALGKMWQVTNGTLPSTEELMQFVIGVQSGVTNLPQTHNHSWQNASGPGWRGRGRGGSNRSRGFGHGNTRTSLEDWTKHDIDQGTDAIVLGGGSEPGDEANGQDSSMIDDIHGFGGVPPGRMQRLGDKWVFVRDPVTTT